MLLHCTYFQHAGRHTHVAVSAESILSNAHVDSRDLAGLAEKWNLTGDGVDFGGLRMRLDYIISDFIIDSMVGAVAYTTDCKDGGVVIPPSDMTFLVVPDETPPGAGEFERKVSVNVTVNPDSIGTSIVYRDEYDEDGKKEAKVEFCMRLSLFTNGDSPIEVNFLETVVGMTAGLSSGFSIDAIALRPKDILVTTALQNYEVDAYQCNDSNEALTSTELAVARNQGEVIRVCVTPNQEAQDQGVFMRAIESFNYNRDYGGPLGLVTQVAIENSAAASNFLTVLYCTSGLLVCVFETVLFSSMFMSPGSVAGSGTALLQLGNNPARRRRRLRNLEGRSSRSLQEDEDGVDAESQFDLDFELVPQEEFNGILKTSSSPTAPKATSLVSSFVAMVVIVYLMSI